MDLQIFRIRHANAALLASTTVSQPGLTSWVCLTGQLAIQVTGDATVLSYLVERSSMDPHDPAGHNAAPADSQVITGSPVQGMTPEAFYEPGVGWWRIRVTDIQGGDALLTISGFHGDGDGVLPGVPVRQ